MRDHSPQVCLVPECSPSPHLCLAWCLMVPGEGSPCAATSAVRRPNQP